MASKQTVNRVLNQVGKQGNSLLSLLSGLLAAFLILYSGYVMYDILYTQNAASGWDWLQYRPEIIDDAGVPLGNADAIMKLNPDYRAWLTLYDTGIDHPVLQGTDDLFYASHDIYGKSSLTGSLYLATDNAPDFSDDYDLIYGHRMDNGLMFGPLEQYSDPAFFRSHQEGVLVISDAVYDLTVFGMLQTDAYNDMVYVVDGKHASNMLPYIRDHAIQYDAGAAAGAEQILAMSTCANARTDGRHVVFAKMVKRTSGDNPVPPSPGPGDDPVPTTEPDDTPYPETPTDTTPVPDSQNATPVSPQGQIGGTYTVPRISQPPATVTPTAAPTVSPSPTARPTGRPSATPRVTPTATPIPDVPESIHIEEPPSPLADFVEQFHPTGGSHGYRAWALLNLVCLAVTVYILIPLLHLLAKYGRLPAMQRANERRLALFDMDEMDADEFEEYGYIMYEAMKIAEERDTDVTKDIYAETVRSLYYEDIVFKRKYIIGLVLEIIISAAALITFVLTEDMRLPMVLIDRWTLLMILLMSACWLADWRLVRYREKTGTGEPDEERLESEEEGL